MFSRGWRRPLVLAIGLLLFVGGFALQLKTQNAFLWQVVTVLGISDPDNRLALAIHPAKEIDRAPRPKGEKRPADVNGNAVMIADRDGRD